MRQSLAAKRVSQVGSLNSQASPAATAKLLEKKKEYDAVSALEKASSLYLERIEGLGEDCEVMADAGRVYGEVLQQWPRMFEILSLFLASRNSSDNLQEEDQSLPDSQLEGQRLVRVPIEELQRVSS